MTVQDVVHILAAMTPCSRLYAFLGRQLALNYPHATHAYKDWIQTYSSDSYHALPAAKEILLNTLSKGAGLGEPSPYSNLPPWGDGKCAVMPCLVRVQN